uniref:Nicotinic acetylcholine receptor alpha 3 subunit n=1 Tax=Bradysia odoriphaga TaxID=1564500 RepID=A0A5C1KAY1_9DIPT|nr:nicotinic acetylcholine receptor alpha 3 subunit [Bradysia odoriphaga]
MRWLRGTLLLMFAVSDLLLFPVICGNPDAKRLYDDLLSNYNKLVRPVVNVSDALTVRIKLKLSQLIDVNLKNQIMTTNLWVEQTWYDYKLKWEPKEYGGVEMLHVPSDHIWRPDIVLYNNADGNIEVTLATKATLNYTGRVEWRPPAIYKSSCEIDVEYFPFDEQTCVMKFGSWTYDGFQVDLRHIDELNGTNIVEVGVDLSEFYTSVEWDILEVPAVRNEKFYTCCDEPYLDITFNITMRRKTLFYTVNLIIPCMGISFLTILVFYLPSDSGEKVSLSISILLSLTVFFLLLAEIIPPTSLVVPLLGKFVLFTMILDTFSICVTVVVLNVHFRSPQTHTMAPWVRTLFINQLPKLLVMRRPLYPMNGMRFSAASRRFMLRTNCNALELRDQIPPLPPEVALAAFDSSVLDHHIMNLCERNLESLSINTCRLHGSPKSSITSPLHRVQNIDIMDDIPLPFPTKENHTNSPASIVAPDHMITPSRRQQNIPPPPPLSGDTSSTAKVTAGSSVAPKAETALRNRWHVCPELHKAMDGITYIADQKKKEEESTKVKEDWKYVAMVLDRLFLWIFTIAVVVGTAGIILQAPTLYDTRVPIDIKMSEIASTTAKPHIFTPPL